MQPTGGLSAEPKREERSRHREVRAPSEGWRGARAQRVHRRAIIRPQRPTFQFSKLTASFTRRARGGSQLPAARRRSSEASHAPVAPHEKGPSQGREGLNNKSHRIQYPKVRRRKRVWVLAHARRLQMYTFAQFFARLGRVLAGVNEFHSIWCAS